MRSLEFYLMRIVPFTLKVKVDIVIGASGYVKDVEDGVNEKY